MRPLIKGKLTFDEREETAMVHPDTPAEKLAHGGDLR
jgi:hypothetical protein